MDKPKNGSFLKRGIRALFRPRPVRLPILFWVSLFLVVGLLIWLAWVRSTPEILPGETRIIVTTPTPGPPPPPGPTPTPVGSGGTVAFSLRHNGNSDIYLLSQNTGKLLRITYDPAEDRDPAWSPDGRWLAFASHRAANWDLYLMDMTSGAVVRFTRDPRFEAGPAWSPDSQWLAYEVYEAGNLDIHVVSASDTEEFYQLTSDPAPDFSPAWSPDGRHIAFTSQRDGSKDIFLISLDGGDLVNLTQTPDQDEDHAAWSHDGAYLAYSSGVPGSEELRILPFDKAAIATGELRPMLFGIGGQPAWSPDDQALTFVFRQGVTSYLVAASTTGWALAQEGYSTEDWMESPAWTSEAIAEEFAVQLEARMAEEQIPHYSELLVDTSVNPGTFALVDLPDVNGGDGFEKLSDRVNDSFNALREAVTDAGGWDYLAILGDSWRPMNHTPRPGQGRISWHVCGRA
ncbi:MAG: PD40 domain-containing protein, partial [Anaerolineae bacterium]|nr:PD40 domain-containing protein [Anaerolineae bacterium]